MDDAPMNRILEVSDFTGGETHAADAASVRPRLGGRFAWERYVRCLVLCAVIAAVGYMAWRPALLRFSQLMFMVSPSHGDSLAWKPDVEDTPVRLRPRRQTPEPAEWRVTRGMHGKWGMERAHTDNRPVWRGSGFLPSRWKRLSGNPWNWRDDNEIKARRGEPGQPAQKPATAFRAQYADAWGTEPPEKSASAEDVAVEETTPRATASTSETEGIPARATSAVPEIPAVEPLADSREAESAEPPQAVSAPRERVVEERPSLAIPSLSPVDGKAGLSDLPPLTLDGIFTEKRESDIPSLPALPSMEKTRSEGLPGVVNLEPLDLDSLAAPTAAAPLRPAEPAKSETFASEISEISEIPDIMPSNALQSGQPESPLRPSATVETPTATVIAQNPPAEATPANPLQAASHGEIIVSSPIIDTPASVDWKNREIIAPIPGAYLTIYPKLKFIGLCVPGQGYIRKYNQIAVPRDASGGKMAAADGRTPYGRYYIAARSRGEQGPRLELSWPSPEDARRIGLDPAQTAMVENAWLGQSLPPQNTAAGGGLALTGLRGWLEATDGGFALEAPHMEEVYTALPDGAWVFVQE